MLKEYFAVLKRHLKLFVGGATLSAIGFIATFVAWLYRADPDWVNVIMWLSFAVLVLSIIPAQYGAWKEERREREIVEAKLYHDADLRGKMTVEIGGYNPYLDQTRLGCFLAISIDAVNQGGTACTIGSIHICVRPPEPITFAPYFEIPLEIEPATVESGNFFRSGPWSITQPGLSPEEFRKSVVTVYLVDGLRQRHTFIKTQISPRILERET